MKNDDRAPETNNRYRSVSRYVFFGFAAVAAYFVITEHRAHLLPLLSFLPFVLLAACPLMHLFHHHGHDDGGSESPQDAKRPPGPGDGAHQH